MVARTPKVPAQGAGSRTGSPIQWNTRQLARRGEAGLPKRNPFTGQRDGPRLPIDTPKKDKRQPLLCDRYLATALVPAPFKKQPQIVVREALRMAKRFVLDDAATRYFAEMIRDAPEIVAMAQEFALRPFEVMYVEFANFKVFYETVSGIPAAPNSDDRIGYLFVGPDVYVMADTREEIPALGPIVYNLNRPIPSELFPAIMREVGDIQFGDGSKLASNGTAQMVDAFFWGSSIVQIPKQYQSVLRDTHGFTMLVDLDNFMFDDAEIKMIYEGSASDLRNIIGLLLFLNQTRDIQYIEELGHHRGFIKNKPSTYLKHSIIQMKISPMPALRKKLIGESGGLWRREHDVRGHFCHDKTARERQCLHDWTEYDVNQWKCRNCNGLRWWRREHRRGHKEKGRVSQEYQVTA